MCAKKFFYATVYQDSSVFGATCMKYVQTHFWKEHNSEHLCALQVFLCALVSWLVCVRTSPQLRGNIGRDCHSVIAICLASSIEYHQGPLLD